MQDDFSLEAYNYILPSQNIAQHPADKRDASKLLVLNRATSKISHSRFSDITRFFNKGDILVMNDTKVFPARLFGRKDSGGKAEVFLLEFPQQSNPAPTGDALKRARCQALIKSSKRPKAGAMIIISETLQARILESLDNGKVILELLFPEETDLTALLADHGTVPLPPYIERSTGVSNDDRERYQTVYAEKSGAVAAPTAGLHFTHTLLAKLEEMGVETAAVTLHVGYGTFAPVRTEAIRDHRIHQERIHLTETAAEKINTVKNAGGKVWAVGTTSVRAIEFCSDEEGVVRGKSGWCDLYIYPGYTFKVIDNLITNFHLPQSSLLFLVAALCGRTTLLRCYKEAIANDYRFYSYGDAMAILS